MAVMEAMTKPPCHKKKGGKKSIKQSNLMNNKNEGKACDYVNWKQELQH